MPQYSVRALPSHESIGEFTATPRRGECASAVDPGSGLRERLYNRKPASAEILSARLLEAEFLIT